MSTRAGLPSAIADLLNGLTSSSLRLDPNARAKLRALDGHHIRIVITPSAMIYSLLVNDGKLTHALEARPDPSVVVTGTASELAHWLTSMGESATVTISGNASVLPELLATLKTLAPQLPASDEIRDGLMKAAQALPKDLPKDLQELAKRARQVVADQLRRGQAADSETDP